MTILDYCLVGPGGFEPLADQPDFILGNGFTDRRRELSPYLVASYVLRGVSSFVPYTHLSEAINLVSLGGLKPPTSRLSVECSNQLNYSDKFGDPIG